MDLSIVIIAYNLKDCLEELLNSIYETTKNINFEVFVVDNASKDGTPEMVSEKFPQVHLIKNTKNKGFGNANNQALEKAKKLDNQNIFIIGGANIYSQALPLADKLYITHVQGDFKADVFFPDYSQFNQLDYKKDNLAKGFHFTFYEYSKK